MRLLKRLATRPSPSMVVALIALFVALGGTTYAATGGTFILGQPNSATSQTGLTSSNAGKALNITQQSTETGATALGLNVPAGKTPFKVNSGTKVTNLNADNVDGKSASELEGARAFANVYGGSCSGIPAYCPIQESKRVDYAVNVGPGDYCVGIAGIHANSSDFNPFLFTHGEPGRWVVRSGSGNCTNLELEVRTYTGSEPDNQFFKILIP